MATEATLSVEERLYRLLRHLGVDQAHFAGWMPQDWGGLVAKYPQVISSLTLVNTFDRRLAEAVSAKLLVVTGDRGPAAETVRNAMRGVPNVQHVELSDYNMLGWSDVAGVSTDIRNWTLFDIENWTPGLCDVAPRLSRSGLSR